MLGRIDLEVRILDDHDVAGGGAHAARDRGALAGVLRHVEHNETGVLAADTIDLRARSYRSSRR